MKYYLFIIVFSIILTKSISQNTEVKQILSEFNLANNSSPAFVLIEESPSEIYVPDNLKALTIHALNNFDGSLSIELNPYYLINTKSEERTFFTYIGVEKISDDDYKQKPFSGINTSSISFAHAKKDFENFSDGERSVFSLGLRTRLLRFYNMTEVENYYEKSLTVLNGFIKNLPDEIENELIKYPGENEKNTKKRDSIIENFKKTRKGKDLIEKLELYRKEVTKKPMKPIFQIDGSLGYSALFKENSVDSGTLNRFGAWLTSEFSLILNKDSTESESNNYINLFLTSRYIEDEFNSNENTLYYRDFGGKIELELGKFSLGYEYIDRNGSTDSERSVGTLKYLINNNLSLNGGFGKDFSSEENLVTLFGINWGINNN